MYRKPVIPAPDEITASVWEAEERAQNERDDLAFGLSRASIQSLTEERWPQKSKWELELDRMEEDGDDNERHFDS